jgi:hypothetical protein
MAHSHEFRLGSATVFLDTERSVHLSDRRRPAGGTRSVTLYVKDPGDMFQVGSRLGALQMRVKAAAKEDLKGTQPGVVNLTRITLYDQSITSYADGVDVATDFVNAFNDRYDQALAAAAALEAKQQSPH